MAYLTLAYLALIASLCEVSVGQSCVRRVRPAGALPRAASAPRMPPPPAPIDSCVSNDSASSYERSLEQLISKLVSALIYTVLQNGGAEYGCGSGVGRSNGSGGSGGGGLLDLDLSLVGKSLLDVGVLGSKSKVNSGSSDSLLDLGVGLGGNPLLNVGLLGSKPAGGKGSSGAGSSCSGCGTIGRGGSGGGSAGSGGDSSLLDVNLGLGGNQLLDVGVLGTNSKGNYGTESNGCGNNVGKGDSDIINALLALGVDLGGISLIDLILGGSRGSGSSDVANRGGSGDPDLLNLKAILAGTPLADLSVL